MTPPNKTAAQKIVLSNSKRIQRLGLHNDQTIQFMQNLSLSPILDVALQFANRLSHMLDQMEFRNAIHGSETVPRLNPDTSFEIGKTVGRGLSYRIGINDLTTHAIVCGASGSGKTTTISRFVDELLGGPRIILIDHKTEGLRFVNRIRNAAYISPDDQRWNCLSGIGDQHSYIRFVCSQLAKLMALLPVTTNAAQAKLLSLCCDRNNLPAISDLSDVFLALAQKELRSSLHTSSRGFVDLAINMGKWSTVRQGNWPFDDYLLSAIPLKDCPDAFEYFYIAVLFRQLMDRAMAGGNTSSLKQLVVFDEGRGFFGKELEPGSGSGRVNLQAKILTQSRSFGIGNIIGSQSVSSIQSTVIDNAGIFIAMRTNSEQEAKICCRRLGLNKSRYMELINMPVGTAWIVSPQCRQPVKIKIQYNDLGDYPSEADIYRRMKPLRDSWDSRTIFAPTKSEAEATIDFRELLGEKASDTEPSAESTETTQTEPNHEPKSFIRKPTDPVIISEYLAILRSCEAHPKFGATAHYKSMGWSMGRGNRVKARLVELGWVETASVISPKGGRPKITLQLTETGRGVLDEPA